MLSRAVTNPLERMLNAHDIPVTAFQLMVKLSTAPASAIEPARRLRLDPAPVSRTLIRMEEGGFVVRASRRRFALWSLTEQGAVHLEVLDPFWELMNAGLRRKLGPDLASRIIRYVDCHPAPRPREHRGWTDD